MDCFEELATVLNSAGMELKNLQSKKKELIKKIFLFADLMKDCSKTNDSSINPFMNYLAVLCTEKCEEA